MPEARFCSRCAGSLTEREGDGEPRLLCSGCGFAHFDSPLAVAGVIIRRDDHVLLVRPVDPPNLAQHVLVSGHLEPYESAEDAAVREARDETGLDIVGDRVLGTYSCAGIGRNMILIVCLARITDGELRLSNELADARWFPLDALPPWPADWPLPRAFADLAALERA